MSSSNKQKLVKKKVGVGTPQKNGKVSETDADVIEIRVKRRITERRRDDTIPVRKRTPYRTTSSADDEDDTL